MNRKLTFDTAPPPGTVNFGVGQPSADLLPASLVRQAADAFLEHAGPGELNYGERQGDASFRAALAGFLSSEYAAPVTAGSLFVSTGSSQALDYVCARFTQPGDTVVVEEPSYFLAFQIFRDHGLRILPVPTDADGMVVAALEEVLTRTRPALLYTIPSFHNPGGQSLSAGRRRRIAQLSREHDFVVAADEVYQLLWYERPPPPAMGTLLEAGNILSLGSFSKIMAPGLRLGWIQAAPALMEVLVDSGAVNSGGSMNQFTSIVMREAIEQGLQAAFLQRLRTTYARRVEAMDTALREQVGDRARWLRPGGGYFYWLELDESVDTAALREHAARFEVGFQPGVNFSSRGALRNCLRLSFAHYPEDEIRDGVGRLARLFDEAL
ncbi:MAG: PLP-dependent aminotransferase family protein [Xanthomonadales bacterium]|nr:PLP-dependent aminotransferase family protein [Xanthomonadales bacterium]